MRIIATVGNSKLQIKHKYIIENKSYEEYLSFMALAKHYDVDDIVLIGTKESQKELSEFLSSNPNITMLVISSDDVQEVFQASLQYFTNETILDLTQGYRHYPMLTLLASSFVATKSNANIKDIYYAQTLDNSCMPYKEQCQYQFVSILKYQELSQIASGITTFINTLNVITINTTNHEFNKIYKELQLLSKSLFSNNFKSSKKLAKKLYEDVKSLKDSKKYIEIDNLLASLLSELHKIIKLSHNQESITLYHYSMYFLSHDILLHSVTMLYESMVAYLDEHNEDSQYHDKSTFRRRNNLKKSLGNCYKNIGKNCHQHPNIKMCKEFSRHLCNIDKLRNTSAHAFTDDDNNKNLGEEIESTHNFLAQIYNLTKNDKI